MFRWFEAEIKKSSLLNGSYDYDCYEWMCDTCIYLHYQTYYII